MLGIMKSEKGITLISVTIYVIVMVLLVAAISIITSYFYKNVNVTTEQDDINKQYTKFVSYFSEEVNREGNSIEAFPDEDGDNKGTSIIFSSGNQYSFIQENKAIYMGSVKIAANIENCVFEKVNDTVIKVKIQSGLFNKTTTFNLRK